MIIGLRTVLLQAFGIVKLTALLPLLWKIFPQDYVSLFKDLTVQNQLCAILTSVSS